MPRAKKILTTKADKKAVGNLPLAIGKTKKASSQRLKANNLSAPVYSLAGRETGTLALPKEYFGQKVNKILLAQAMKVYMTNQKEFTASSQTRGEVKGTTKKMYSQKGTGRARHGAATAPIFVGGGIVFGPRPRVVRLDLPKKMKKAALISAFSDKAADKKIIGLTGLEKSTGKTKQMASVLKKIGIKNALLITGQKEDNVIRAVRNIPKVDILPVNLLNAFEVIKHHTLIVTKETLDRLAKNEVKS